MASFSIINPYTNKIIESRHYEELANVDIKIEALQHGFSQWKKKALKTEKKNNKEFSKRNIKTEGYTCRAYLHRYGKTHY